jgi:hypothetical protein
MIVVIKFKLLFLVDSTFEKLTVDLLFWFEPIEHFHGPGINNENRIVAESEDKPRFVDCVLAEANYLFTEKIMCTYIDTASVS